MTPEHEELEKNPETPFLNDIEKDLQQINKHYNLKTSKEIKLKMINLIAKSL